MSIEYEEQVEKPPTHLTLDFFEDVAENALRQTGFKIDKVVFSMGSNTGENYCSLIYRAKIFYRNYNNKDDKEDKSLSVIVKSMWQSEAVEFLQDLQVFLKEKIAYNDVLPRLEAFLDNGEKFSARLYFSLKRPLNTLVFEDLKTKNYEMANREKGLDEAHARLVMQKLGKFHATSMVLGKKDPGIMKCFNFGMLSKVALSRENSMLLRYMTDCANSLVDLVSSWPGYEKITQKLQKYAANVEENLGSCQDPISGEIKVLNHGDLWVNNVLFKYDEERNLKDLIFVDYQMSFWGSPGIDLNYFFYTSLQLDILKYKRTSLLQEYHKTLAETLVKLNYTDLPSFKQIEDEVRRREPYGFFANFGILPTISMDKEESSDNKLDNFLDEDFARNKVKQMFRSKRLSEVYRFTLNKFDDLGIWD